MKWFCYLFSAYVFVLTCFPCNDGEHGHGMLEPGQTTFAAAPVHPADHQACDDLCSPFCTCACCGSTLQVAQSVFDFTITAAPILVSKRLFPDHSLWLKDVVIAIDHPPQLA
jgi:hypothetical protein